MENSGIEIIEIIDDNENKKENNENLVFCPICNKNLTGFSENVKN